MVNVAEIVSAIEEFAPLNTAAEWDNSGWQINLGNSQTKKILLALNIDNNIVGQAIAQNCDLIISHHPLLFAPLMKIEDECIINAIQNNIQVYSAHTNLDVVKGGTTDTLAQKAGFLGCSCMNDFVRYKFLDEKLSLGGFIDDLKRNLKINEIRLINQNNKPEFKSVAFCAGSGASFIQEVKKFNIDLFITADVKYHDSIDAQDLIVIDAGHFESEKFVSEIFRNILREKNVEIIIADEKNTWQSL